MSGRARTRHGGWWPSCEGKMGHLRTPLWDRFGHPRGPGPAKSEDEESERRDAPPPPLDSSFQASRLVPVGPGFRLLVFNTNRVLESSSSLTRPRDK